jgi:hypothetical protein
MRSFSYAPASVVRCRNSGKSFEWRSRRLFCGLATVAELREIISRDRDQIMPGSDVSDAARATARPAQPVPPSVQGPTAELAEPQLDSSPAPDPRVIDNKSVRVRPCPRADLRLWEERGAPIGGGRLISLTGGADTDNGGAFSAGKWTAPQPTRTQRFSRPFSQTTFFRFHRPLLSTNMLAPKLT